MRKTWRDIAAPLLAAEKSGWRQPPKSFGDVQTRQQIGGACMRLFCGSAKAPQWLGHALQRRHARHHAQKQTDIAQGLAPQRDDLSGLAFSTSSPPTRTLPEAARQVLQTLRISVDLPAPEAPHSPAGTCRSAAFRTGIIAEP